MTQLPWIDWDTAEKLALQLVPPGPKTTHAERDQIVRQLRGQAQQASGLIAEASGLPLLGAARELVVDRRTLVRANVTTARKLTRSGTSAPAGGLDLAAGRARGATIGGLLATLAGRILGQYDPFGDPPTLYLAAPTIMAVERQLKVNPTHFRMWVVLHEQTHRVQFANAPWLPDHLVTLIGAMLAADEQPLWHDLDQRIARFRRDTAEDRPASLRLINAVSSPELVAALDQVTAVMSLLEGHADVMMDRAGRSVMPGIAEIRARFNARRARGGIHGLVNRLLGMDAKLAQYADGARFCRYVLRRGGVQQLNRVFEGPASLPAQPELLHPEQWYQRMTSAVQDADGQA